jgi:hypothetical protein
MIVSYGVWTGRWLMSQTTAYDPEAERCQSLPKSPDRPGFRSPTIQTHEFHTPFWADGRLVIWSGGTGMDGDSIPADGAIFRPAAP